MLLLFAVQRWTKLLSNPQVQRRPSTPRSLGGHGQAVKHSAEVDVAILT
jgi:hypothetical protein